MRIIAATASSIILIPLGFFCADAPIAAASLPFLVSIRRRLPHLGDDGSRRIVRHRTRRNDEGDGH
jgi:hypothetical protein